MEGKARYKRIPAPTPICKRDDRFQQIRENVIGKGRSSPVLLDRPIQTPIRTQERLKPSRLSFVDQASTRKVRWKTSLQP